MKNTFDFQKTLLKNDIGKYSLDRVDVLSPYLSVGFFQLINKFNPNSIHITTDISCSADEISRIEDLLGKDSIKYAKCDGIVHIKCYVFHWKEINTPSNYKRFFVWGSANATIGGFSKNAELISWIDISDKTTEYSKKICHFFKRLEKGTTIETATHIAAGDLNILLPPIVFTTTSSDDNFESWLQTGRLCQPFPPESNFRHFKIKLRNSIKPENDLVEKLAAHKIETTYQSTISYDYFRKSNSGSNILHDFDHTDSGRNWRSKYFIHTSFGYWTSRSCYKEKHLDFKKPNDKVRESEINAIKKSTEHQQEEWISDFLNLLKLIVSETPNASTFFHCKYKYGNLVLDHEKYYEIK